MNESRMNESQSTKHNATDTVYSGEKNYTMSFPLWDLKRRVKDTHK